MVGIGGLDDDFSPITLLTNSLDHGRQGAHQGLQEIERSASNNLISNAYFRLVTIRTRLIADDCLGGFCPEFELFYLPSEQKI